MREIKFRGLSKYDNKWMYGDLRQYTDGVIEILDNCRFGYETKEGYWDEVIPKSVGQYTGKKDRSGVDIYEGDIVRESYQGDVRDLIVEYDKYRTRFLPMGDPVDYDEVFADNYEVIGNIYQNPELLKKSEGEMGFEENQEGENELEKINNSSDVEICDEGIVKVTFHYEGPELLEKSEGENEQ